MIKNKHDHHVGHNDDDDEDDDEEPKTKRVYLYRLSYRKIRRWNNRSTIEYEQMSENYDWRLETQKRQNE